MREFFDLWDAITYAFTKYGDEILNNFGKYKKMN
jgi:hypothetical protein